MATKTKAPLRILCDGMKGENYWLNGCMTYLAACIDLPEDYNYQFFTCISGDSVTQVFSKDPGRDVWAYSHECTAEALKRCFRAIGYEYIYISSIKEPQDCLSMIRETLERGLPVFARGGGTTDVHEIEFNCIVGYYEDALYYLFCDKDHETRVTVYDFRELVIPGEKTDEPVPLNEAYRKALCQVPAMLTLKATDEFSFGIQALNDWAEQLENGSLAGYDNPWHNVWSVHGTYLCMLGSNGSGFGLYDKVLQYYPEMIWLQDVRKQYDVLSDIFQTLAYKDGGVCGGFDMKPEDVQDPEKMKPVCVLIRQAAEIHREIADRIAEGLK